MMTRMYLLRHAATEANLAQPPRLQGRRHNPPLARLGVRQAEATRDYLAVRPIDAVFCSPMLRAIQTATIIAAPHGLSPVPIEALTECDVGRWEGLAWEDIRYFDAADYQNFRRDPSVHGYPDGENFAEVHARASAALEEIWAAHAGKTVLVVAHHVVNRTYLAGLLGLPLDHARAVTLDNCGISVVTRAGAHTHVETLNAAFHLQGVAA
jgi:broad specificity phosphatase PhoE